MTPQPRVTGRELDLGAVGGLVEHLVVDAS
jgi:hypothetical protein